MKYFIRIFIIQFGPNKSSASFTTQKLDILTVQHLKLWSNHLRKYNQSLIKGEVCIEISRTPLFIVFNSAIASLNWFDMVSMSLLMNLGPKNFFHYFVFN